MLCSPSEMFCRPVQTQNGLILPPQTWALSPRGRDLCCRVRRTGPKGLSNSGASPERENESQPDPKATSHGIRRNLNKKGGD